MLKDQNMPKAGLHKPRVGISLCLLGEPVRFDGGHKRHSGIVNVLSPLVQWVPVCPEVELGLAVPREPLTLIGDSGASKLIGKDSGKDYTLEMSEYCREKALELKAAGLDGFVFKKSSPSCGVEGVKVYANLSSEVSAGKAAGFFAAIIRQTLPHLPLAEEDELDSPEAVDEFIRRMRV